MKRLQYKTKYRPKGFTLVELMVSLSIFSMVTLISIGTLLVMIDANAKAQALYSSTTNLSFALDSMTRELRMGYDYYCGSDFRPNYWPSTTGTHDCTDGDYIVFTRQRDGKRVAYDRNAVNAEGNRGEILQYIDGSASGVPITSSDLDITSFDIIVNGAASGDTEQPTITFFIEGETSNGLTTPTDFSIQTQITQQQLDLI